MSVLLAIAVGLYVWAILKENKPKLGTNRDLEAKAHYAVALVALLLCIVTLFSSVIASAAALVLLYFRAEVIKVYFEKVLPFLKK